MNRYRRRRIKKTFITSTLHRIGILMRNRYVKMVFAYILVAGLLAGLILTVKFMYTSDYFTLKEVELISSTKYSYPSIQDYTTGLEGRNIFSLRPSKIQEELSSNSIYIKEVIVEKELPDKLKIRIEERVPAFAIVNLTGAYLIDEEGVIVDMHDRFDDIALSTTDKDLLRGYHSVDGKPNISVTTDNSSSSTSTDNTSASQSSDSELSEEEILEIEQKELVEKRKLRGKLEKDQQLIVSKVHSFWRNYMSDSDEFYEQYKVVYSYRDEGYEIGSKMSPVIFDFTNSITHHTWESLHPAQFTIESEVKFSVDTKEETTIFFSMNNASRDVDSQLRDLGIVLEDARYYSRSYSVIDLGNVKILVEEK